MSGNAYMERFKRDRDEALLSLDEQKIRAYCSKYGEELSEEPEVFWRAVHKARTALTSFPMEERIKSKRWLLARGSEPMDDGDVPA